MRACGRAGHDDRKITWVLQRQYCHGEGDEVRVVVVVMVVMMVMMHR